MNNVRVRHASTPSSFALLFVCTGNICRSPFAELLTAHLLSERLGSAVRSFRLGSAGVNAVVGSKMHPDTRLELFPWGLSGAYAEKFTARQLLPDMVAEADLVLTATMGHRTQVLELHPPALAKTFTLNEFARLIKTIDPGALPVDPLPRVQALTQKAPAQRALHRTDKASKKDEDSISDPMGKNRRAHQIAAHQIARAVTTIAETIAL